MRVFTTQIGLVTNKVKMPENYYCNQQNMVIHHGLHVPALAAAAICCTGVRFSVVLFTPPAIHSLVKLYLKHQEDMPVTA